ncbi:hypothetical protein Syun_014439 [Stephania yunnanensis]|uniref:Uncharacterized protein n=1 Tax=Stephania yunnanensis TaxID=152371 RepID=A0AAP0JJR5_9MAGN
MAMDSAAAVRRGVRRMKGDGAVAVIWALRDGPTESAQEERGDGGENAFLSHFPRPRRHRHHSSFASLFHHQHHRPNHAFDLALTPNFVAYTLSGTSVYTVSNSNNEFVLVSDPNDLEVPWPPLFPPRGRRRPPRPVQLRQPVLGRGVRVVPITLDQVLPELELLRWVMDCKSTPSLSNRSC